MKRTLFFLLPLLPLALPAREWTTYMSYNNNTYNYAVSGVVYNLAGGSLFTYEEGDSLVNLYSKSTGLSDVNIQYAAYCPDEEAFILIYEDGCIDILTLGDSITPMTELKNSSLSDKTINHLTVVGSNAYIGSNAGVIVVNIARREFTNIYDFGLAVRSCASADGKIFALTSEGIYVGSEDDNLLDPSAWSRKSTSTLNYLLPLNGELYAKTSSSLLKINTSTGYTSLVMRTPISYATVGDEEIFFWNDTALHVLDADADITTYPLPDDDFLSFSRSGDLLWASCGYRGLQAYTIESDTLQPQGGAIIPDSPIRNYTYYLDYTASGRLLIAGGSLNYTGVHNDGTVMLYDGETWTNFPDTEVEEATGLLYRDVTAVIEDPLDPAHHYASAAGGGLYEFRDAQFEYLYTYTNSPLATILPNDTAPGLYVRTSGLCYDDDGNLWMFNNGVDTVLHVLLSTGEWDSYYFSTLAEYPTFDKLILDSRGWFWGTHRRTTSSHHAGILCFANNGTTSTHADDSWKFVYRFTNQDNTSYTFDNLYDVVEDRNGLIWIGTDQGPFLLEDPSDIWESSPVFTQIVIPRNDGTNYGDYLLTGVPILSIAIDGDNRKWFGTNGYGVYLISDDGLETLEHFTSANSPLLSDIVYDIAIRPETGEVMFATDEGLVSYMGDATEPLEELDEDNLLIYPNPVKPEFGGSLRIDGLTEDADVKITTVSGQLVYSGTSVGGSFSWDLRDRRGRRAASGVYYVIVATSDGDEAVAGKFVVIK